jgi:hypothetical protein
MIINSLRESGKQVIFPTLSDLLSTLDGKTPAYKSRDDASWSGTATLQEAVDIARHGWTHGRETVDAILGTLESSLQQVAHDMVMHMTHDVVGAYPDMGRFMEGEPECMVQFVPQADTTSGQVTRLLIDNGACAKYTADWMTRRAGAVTALVQALTMVGKSVEVWVASPVKIDGLVHDTVVCVHQAGMPVNVDAIAFCLGHPAMLRRIMFECRQDRKMGHAKGVGGTYGKHHPETVEYVQPHILVQRAENEPSSVPDPASKPLEWVRFQLNKLGLLP